MASIAAADARGPARSRIAAPQVPDNAFRRSDGPAGPVSRAQMRQPHALLLPQPVLNRQVQLALLVASTAGAFVVVGGTGRLLRGDRHTPADLDIVVTPPHAAPLATALGDLAVDRRAPQLVRASPRRVVTSWSPVDVFMEDDLPAWKAIEIQGMRLLVAND